MKIYESLSDLLRVKTGVPYVARLITEVSEYEHM